MFLNKLIYNFTKISFKKEHIKMTFLSFFVHFYRPKGAHTP